MSTVINIHDKDGNPMPWRTLAGRIGEVLKAYPMTDGWAIRIESEALGFQMQDEYDIPRPAVRFTANLVDPKGVIVATGSAAEPISGHFAWSKGESRARNRLFAAIGFGGEILDLDESALVDEYNRRHEPRAKAPPAPVGKDGGGEDSKAPKVMAVPTAADLDKPSHSLVQQIADRSKALGIKVPAYKTAKEAKKVWADLLARKTGE